MTKPPPPLKMRELLSAARVNRPDFSMDQLAALVWDELWAGELDGSFTIAFDPLLAAWVNPTGRQRSAIHIPETHAVPDIRSADGVADLLSTLLRFANVDDALTTADHDLLRALDATPSETKEIAQPSTDLEAPIAQWRANLAGVPWPRAAGARVVSLFFDHAVFEPTVAAAIKERIISTPTLLEAAQVVCTRWLIDRMSTEMQRPQKLKVQADAIARFEGLTGYAFKRAWTEAASKVPTTTWTKRGPKPGSPKPNGQAGSGGN
jgi:hypothetical protein